MSLTPKRLEVAGHMVSAWSVGTRRFISFSTRTYIAAVEVKETLEKQGWNVDIEEMDYGIYLLTAEITIKVKPDAPAPDSSESTNEEAAGDVE